MKQLTKDLQGDALHWAIASCVGAAHLFEPDRQDAWPRYSDSAAQARKIYGPAGVKWINNGRTDRAGRPYRWLATKNFSDPQGSFFGPTPEVAALRCFVAGELGPEVDVPEWVVSPGAQEGDAPSETRRRAAGEYLALADKQDGVDDTARPRP